MKLLWTPINNILACEVVKQLLHIFESLNKNKLN